MKRLYTTGYGIQYPIVMRYYRGCLRNDDQAVLVLPGGGDVDARWYGMDNHPTMYGVDNRKDALEFAALQEALTYRRPVIAICRGHQLTAVAFGAKLIQDIQPPHDGFHELTFITQPTDELGQRIYREAQQLFAHGVNSLHHQGVAVQAVPTDAICIAHHAEVSELLWYPKHRILSTQFHPEWMRNQGLQFLRTFLEAL